MANLKVSVLSPEKVFFQNPENKEWVRLWFNQEDTLTQLKNLLASGKITSEDVKFDSNSVGPYCILDASPKPQSFKDALALLG